MTEWIEKAISTLAASQWGYVTRHQLLDLGLSPDAIAYRISTGRLIPVHAGVYAVGHLPVGPVAHARAAVLACGNGSVLSHGSAATLWGFFKYWDTPFEVTARSKRTRPGITVHRSKTLADRDLDRQLDVPVTSPARTLLDITARLTDRRLRRVVNDARLGPHLHLDDLADVLNRNPRHPGTNRLRWFTEAPSGVTRSGVEDDFVAFTQRYGLPAPAINTVVNGCEVDVLFVEERVIVEVDTWPTHGSRSSFERDRERDATMLAFDYLTVRVTEDRFKLAPALEARRLHAILRARRAA